MDDTSSDRVSLINQARLGPERILLYDIIGRFRLEPMLVHYEEEELDTVREQVLGTCLKLSTGLSPRLFTLLEQVRAKLEYHEPLDLFVEADANINAYAIHAINRSPHTVVLTSSLIERMNDDELKFVIGHEIGHIQYQHCRSKYIRSAIGGEDNMPRLLRRKLHIWGRLAELSADRAGFIAADSNLESITSAFFKLASGLGPEHLKFDISVFLQQLAELQDLDGSTVFCGFSHPITPVRVRALQLIKNVIGNIQAWKEMDEEVIKLSKLMDLQAVGQVDKNGRDFVLAGGILVGAADDGFSAQEQEVLVEMLLPLINDPEEEIARIKTTEQAKSLMASSAEWLKDNAGEERFTIISWLARVAAVDGVLHPKEEELLKYAAGLLGVPWRVARKQVYEILAEYLQAQITAKIVEPVRLQ